MAPTQLLSETEKYKTHFLSLFVCPSVEIKTASAVVMFCTWAPIYLSDKNAHVSILLPHDFLSEF